MLKYALITGSTRGIGRQIAEDFLKKEIFVILNYSFSDQDAAAAARVLSRISKKFAIVKSDLSSFESLEYFIGEVKKITQNLDYLVFNAGVTKRCGFEEINIEDWMKIFNANVNLPFFILQGLNRMIRKNGRIIFIGSILGIYPHAVSIPYGVSKSCLEIMAKYLIKEFLPRKITVNVVAPGFVDTSWQKGKSRKQKIRIAGRIALKRFADPREISSSCLHLLENEYINGQTIIVDGGYDYE